ncbi:SAM-dependent methyltransferase [Shewanella gaetbuli]
MQINTQSQDNDNKAGRLVCVGTGIQLAGQISPISQSYIETADVVFSLVTDGFSTRWLNELNDDVRSLQTFYAKEGEIKSRRQSYDEMVEAILSQVAAGKLVVCAFYGHPGVFACVSHMAIKQAKQLGYKASMLPGISAEACLWADINVDPGNVGFQSLEATQFLLYNHVINPYSYLLLWQIALAGEHTLTQFSTTEAKLNTLVEHLQQWYSLSHEVIIYEAANVAFQQPRVETITLAELPTADLNAISTLVVPPVAQLTLNQQILTKLNITAAEIG